MAGHIWAPGFDFFEDPPLPWPAPILASPPPLPTPPSSLHHHQAHAAHHAHLRQHLQRVPSLSSVPHFGAPSSSSPFFPSPPPPPHPLSHPHQLPASSPGSGAPSAIEQQTASQLPDEQEHARPRNGGSSAALREGVNRRWPPRRTLPSLSSVVGQALPANWDFSNIESPPPRSTAPFYGGDYFPAILNADFTSPSIPPASPFAYRAGAEADDSFFQPPQQPAQLLTPREEAEAEAAAAAASEIANPFKRERPQSEEYEIPSSSPIVTMPALRKRAAVPTVVESEGPASKRRRTSQASARPRVSPKRLKREDPALLENDFKDLFGSDDEKDEAVEMLDLVDVNENEDVIDPTPKEDKSIRLSTFQCVICMDDVQDLTVTYCGHLFCSACLHSSLHIDATKKICPICRQKIELRKLNPRAGSRTYFPLELKLMTRNRIGKRPAR